MWYPLGDRYLDPFREAIEIGPIEKMSKSKRNTVDPDDIIASFGADTARWFMLSDSPPERDVIWTEEGVQGAGRFVQRVWRLVGEIGEPNLEQIAALKPDLILGSDVRVKDFYDELSAIAPTVFTESVGVTWKENLKVHAQALGREEQAAALMTAYQKRAA